MRYVQRGGGGESAVPEPTQETVVFDAATPWAITKAINDTCEKLAVRVVSISTTYWSPAFPPEELKEKGPFYAIVVFEEDLNA